MPSGLFTHTTCALRWAHSTSKLSRFSAPTARVAATADAAAAQDAASDTPWDSDVLIEAAGYMVRGTFIDAKSNEAQMLRRTASAPAI